MTFSLRFRKQVAVLAILITVMVATYLAAPRDGSRVRQIQGADLNQHSITRTIESLNQREVVHILAHVLIFGGIAFWLGAWGTPSGSVGLGWRYGMGGGILTEVAQTMVGIGSYTAMGIAQAVAFDLVVDAVSVAGGVWLAAQVPLMSSAARQTARE
jgi:hypothetical protein